jgi:hypothetical protein
MSQTKAQLIEGSAASELTAAKTLLGAGSVGAPSLTATGDTNTGIFFPTADTIAFAEGGAEALRVDSSGRLLVGTSSSSGYQLEVSGSFRSDSTVRNGIFFADSNTGTNIGAQAKLYRLAKGYVNDTINNVDCFQFNISAGSNSFDYAAFAGKLTIVQAGASTGGSGFRTAYFINILVFRHSNGTISLTLGAPEVLGTAISPTITLTSASNTQAVLGIDLNATQNTRDGFFTATLEGSTVGRSANDQFTISVV